MRILCPLVARVDMTNLKWCLIGSGHQVDTTPFYLSAEGFREEEAQKLSDFFRDKNFDCVMSVVFVASVARVCHDRGVPYLSWVYDSPQKELYTVDATYPTNHIFIFDRKQQKRLQEFGLSQVYHLPLAANMQRMSAMVMEDSQIEAFAGQVSFVGQLYRQDYWNNLLGWMEPAVAGELQDQISGMVCDWSALSTVFGKVSEESIRQMKSHTDATKNHEFGMSERYLYEMMIVARRVSQLDRIQTLRYLGEYLPVQLFTGSVTTKEELGEVMVRPPVHPDLEAPIVYYASKVNLNITLRSIESGVPQRIFDILSVGGFVLSNWQEEIPECFEVGKEIETYANMEELLDKAIYYTRHDRERLTMTYKGYQRMQACHTYQQRVDHMLSYL